MVLMVTMSINYSAPYQEVNGVNILLQEFDTKCLIFKFHKQYLVIIGSILLKLFEAFLEIWEGILFLKL